MPRSPPSRRRWNDCRRTSPTRSPPASRSTSATASHEGWPRRDCPRGRQRSEEHTSELQSLMRISYAVFCLKKKKKQKLQKTKAKRIKATTTQLHERLNHNKLLT